MPRKHKPIPGDPEQSKHFIDIACEVGPKSPAVLQRHVLQRNETTKERADRGFNAADAAPLQLFTRRTGALLRHQKKRGILRSVKDPQHGRFDLWEIAL
jgi:hypothetical protein